MTESELDQLRFPIGRWEMPATTTAEDRASFIATLREFPDRIHAVTAHLGEANLNRAYRPDGWTVRQVTHHCADSHLNCLVRLKLTLSEDKPTIRPYMEDRWAKLPDYSLPVGSSLDLIRSVHARIVFLMEGLTEADWQREYVHPEYGKVFRLDQVASLYAWHCHHHLGHIGIALSAAQ